jgi:homoserine kinase
MRAEPNMQPNEFSVSIPATSANLGPGFDAVGIALSMQLRARVKKAKRFSIQFAGTSVPSHEGYERAILDAMMRLAPQRPCVNISIENEIPLGKGLGSSAAASILGLLVGARASGTRLSRNEVAEHACALEGHPDNALPALFGGAVISVPGARITLPAPKGVAAVVVVPQIDLSTKAARALLPERYSRSDMAFTAGRASLLGAALASGSWSALHAAMGDRMHQPYRAKKIPGLDDALSVRARGLLGVALSGAGPSVLAFVRERSASSVAAKLCACFERAGIPAESFELRFASRGASVRG